ncbi:alpha/beta hydrolase family esterase [Halioglobus maricola]|uniref:alpha/beta hydrolase family esterase n=1 Tax=Halioglobus maricola TaxID=2601894 RepID=UPI00197ADF4C|nr:PHB depolymerase family esterase [Halioglobus maricola]
MLSANTLRPTQLFIPASYHDGRPAPLLILLHGFGLDGRLQDAYLHIKPAALERGYLYAHPNGTRDAGGSRFWNSGEACCNFFNASVDDAAYITELVNEAKERFKVDPERVFLVGYSNGGFLAHKLACDQADTFAAIVSIAGSMDSYNSPCMVNGRVSVLQVHGTLDLTILYSGGMLAGSQYKGAMDTAETWAARNGCQSPPEKAPNIDLEAGIAGRETGVYQWRKGCDSGAHVELWKINAASHAPLFNKQFTGALLDFLDDNIAAKGTTLWGGPGNQ